MGILERHVDRLVSHERLNRPEIDDGKTKEGKKITKHMVSVVVRILRAGNSVAVLFGDLDQGGLDDLTCAGLDANARCSFSRTMEAAQGLLT